MPNLPIQELDAAYPSRSGTPRGTQEIPVVPNQPGSLGASQVLGSAISGLGTSVLQANELAQQRQAIEERKRQADELIASKLASQKTVVAGITASDEESQNPDYATLAPRVEARWKQLIAEGGQGMSTRARQLYESQVYDNMAVFKQRAIETTSKRREEAGGLTLKGAKAQAQQGMLAAQTPFEYIVARSHLEETAQQMVAVGMIREAPANEFVREAIAEVDVQRVQNSSRARPRETLAHLRDLNNGGKGTPGFPVPPATMLHALIDDAQKQVDAGNQRIEHGERMAEGRSVRAARQVEQGFNERISTLDATEASLPALRRELDLANSDEQQRALGPEGHDRVVTRIRGRMDVALGAQTRGEQAKREGARDQVEMDFRIQIRLARTPQQLEELEKTLLERGPTLDPAKFGELDRLLKERLSDASPSHRTKYKEAMDYVQRAAMVPGMLGTGMSSTTKPKLLDALDAFDFRYRKALIDEGMEAADQQAMDFAQEARLKYFPPTKSSIPKALRDAKDEVEAGKVLSDMAAQGVPVPVRKAYLEAWRAHGKAQSDKEEIDEEAKRKPKK